MFTNTHIKQQEIKKTVEFCRFPQDLHIHTTYSVGDSAIVEEQTIEFIAGIKHAEVVGISDHLESFAGYDAFCAYEKIVRAHGLYLGTEVNGADSVPFALALNTDYYIYHCFDTKADYKGAENLANTGKPLIIAHPTALGTNLDRVPPESYIEINNRYIWRKNWRQAFEKYVNRFHFVISSDAHQPFMLAQHTARHIAGELGVKATILFEPNH